MISAEDRVLKINYLEHLPPSKNTKILDVGCGNGRVLNFLKSQGYENFLGVDIDSKSLEEISTDLKTKTLLINNLSDFLKSENTQYDCIIAKDVIYYFTRSEATKIMREIASKLNTNGKIIIEIFNGAQLTAAYTANKDLGIQTVYTEHSLKQLLDSAGLKVTHIFGQKQPYIGVKKRILNLILSFFYKFVFLAERGVDENNPKIFTKSIIAVAQKD
ncbi:MAG: class I SAM-dependent methyltransferase [Oligoflexia bacterium]|nr:class I SAM-dependent methyltransferase [Oligoflexia bacterium]